MLRNKYILPKIGVDTAENEPSEVWPVCPGPPAGSYKQPCELLVLHKLLRHHAHLRRLRRDVGGHRARARHPALRHREARHLPAHHPLPHLLLSHCRHLLLRLAHRRPRERRRRSERRSTAVAYVHQIIKNSKIVTISISDSCIRTKFSN